MITPVNTGRPVRRRGIALALAALATLSLAACDTMSELMEPKEVPIPGERQSVFTDVGSGSGAAAVKSEGASISLASPRMNADWAQPGGDAANAPGNLALSGGRSWRISAPALGDSSPRSAASPIVYGGRLFVYGDDGQVNAYSLGGARGWSASAKPEGNEDPDAPGGGIAGADGRIVAVTGFGSATALSAENGGRVWQVRLPEPARSAPTIANGKVYFVTAQNRVMALSLNDGSTVWQFAGIPEPSGLVSSASPAVSGGEVIVPSSSGEIVALDAEKGTGKWQGTLARAARYSAVSGLSAVAGRPVVLGGMVYAAGVSGRMVAIQQSSGRPVWEKQIASAHTPAVSGNAVFVVSLANDLFAMDRTNGRYAWTMRLPSEAGESWAGPTLANGSLWVGSSKGRLLAVNAMNGEVISQKQIGDPIFVAPIVASGSLLVTSGRGSVTAAN
jgi:outer membrane protein assembly factor BamB